MELNHFPENVSGSMLREKGELRTIKNTVLF
jgi:hypothetical protein